MKLIQTSLKNHARGYDVTAEEADAIFDEMCFSFGDVTALDKWDFDHAMIVSYAVVCGNKVVRTFTAVDGVGAVEHRDGGFTFTDADGGKLGGGMRTGYDCFMWVKGKHVISDAAEVAVARIINEQIRESAAA
jgi:hypothetical protein